jgi:hypothetical protein
MKTVRIIRCVLLAATAAAAASCGSAVRDGRAPVILVVDSISGIRGAATAGTATASLSSDVLTLVTSGGTCSTGSPCPTVFSDSGTAGLHLVMKDIGAIGTTPSPSSNNQVTITRVHVSYRRTDGRNQEGVDVPYAFDAGSTLTVTGSSVQTLGFPLVRTSAKQEAPLMALRTSGQVISVVAEVTFYGQDVVGNTVTALGTINIDFANFGD